MTEIAAVGSRGARPRSVLSPSRLRVCDVMSTPAITVGVDAPLKRVAALLHAHRISGLPVVDAGRRLVGVVTETDVLGRSTSGTASGPVAGELMSAPAETIPATATLVDAARRLNGLDIRRLVVVDGERRPVGVVARNDLLRAVLRSDGFVERDATALIRAIASRDGDDITTRVRDGVVHLSGHVRSARTAELLVALVSACEGVVDVVVDALDVVRQEDTARRTS